MASCQKSTCIEKSRIVNYEQNADLLESTVCGFCNKIAGDISQCQLGCGAVFGYGCFQAHNDSQCPNSKCEKKLDKRRESYKNRYLNKFFSNSIKLKCKNWENGCKEELSFDLDIVQRHEECCQYYAVSCPKADLGCSWKGGKALIEEHQQECQFNQSECKSCVEQKEATVNFAKEDFDLHKEACPNMKTNAFLEVLEAKKSSTEHQETKEIIDESIKIIKQQKSQIQEGNERISELIKYAVSLERTNEKKRDKEVLLKDFRQGIINFNSLENLTQSLKNFSSSLIKGVKLNDANLTCYEYSYSSEKDYTQTLKQIKAFAEGGEKNSQYSLGRLYYWGDKNIGQNIEKTKYWVEQAMKKQSPEAFWLMGDLFYEKRGDIKQDQRAAFDYYKKASAMGNGEAFNSLGQMYDDGEGLEANEQKALECFQKSAQLGDYGGLYNLAVYHQEGYGGLVKNYEKAFNYYFLSAKKGDIDAMKKVGHAYKIGKGVNKNLSKSDYWYKKANEYKKKYSQDQPSVSTMSSINSANSLPFSAQSLRSDVI